MSESDEIRSTFAALRRLLTQSVIDEALILEQFAAVVADLVDRRGDERQRMRLNAHFDESLLRAVHQNEMARRLNGPKAA